MRVGALFSAQWRQENRLKLRVGGEISLTLREGQTERGGQVGLRKCVSTSLACALIRARPCRGDCGAGGKFAFRKFGESKNPPGLESSSVFPQTTTSHLEGSLCFRFGRRDVVNTARSASTVTCAAANGTARCFLGNGVLSRMSSLRYFEAMTRCPTPAEDIWRGSLTLAATLSRLTLLGNWDANSANDLIM